MTSYLVEDLTHKDKLQEAVGIMKRNQVEGFVRPEIFDKLKDVVYNQAMDTSLQ